MQNMLQDFVPQFNTVKREGDKFLETSFTFLEFQWYTPSFKIYY